MKRIPTPLVGIVLMLLAGFALAAQPKIVEEHRGKVIGVSDGDTIKVLVNRDQITVRLEGIDAPESKQSFGTKSKQALSEAVFGKNVLVKKSGADRYGRTLGIIEVDSVDINAMLVEEGWAWHYKQYSTDERLAKLEQEARKARRGLWADENPLAPWEFRARQRTTKTDSKPAPEPAALFWLNISSGVRHNERCEHFKNTKRGRICGHTEGRACGICGG